MINSGYNLKMELTEFTDGLDVRYAKQRARMVPMFASLCVCLFSRVIVIYCDAKDHRKSRFGGKIEFNFCYFKFEMFIKHAT